MKLKYLTALVFMLVVALAYLILMAPSKSNLNTFKAPIRYVSIGDSYTIGLGVEEEARWPNLMVEDLNREGFNIELIGNPSVSGFTVRDAINIELPIVKIMKPDFVTVFIGANDNFGQREVGEFKRDLVELLDELQSVLVKPKNIVLITLPDYSNSPAIFKEAGDGITESIAQYNNAIKEEGKKRGLGVADISPVSLTMTGQSDYIEDGLHPSRAGYEKWKNAILPTVRGRLESP